MKQLLLFLCLGLLSLQSVFAQAEIGLKFGFNISNVIANKSVGDIMGYGEIESLHLGIIGNLALSNRFNIKIEFFAIGKGYDPRVITQGPELQVLQGYIATPVLLKYEAIPKLSVIGGLEPSLLLATYWNNGLEFVNVSELFEEQSKFDLGLSAGLEFRFAKRWSLDVRYNRGILFLNRDIFRAYNRSFYFSIHRYFGGKEK